MTTPINHRALWPPGRTDATQRPTPRRGGLRALLALGLLATAAVGCANGPDIGIAEEELRAALRAALPEALPEGLTFGEIEILSVREDSAGTRVVLLKTQHTAPEGIAVVRSMHIDPASGRGARFFAPHPAGEPLELRTTVELTRSADAWRVTAVDPGVYDPFLYYGEGLLSGGAEMVLLNSDNEQGAAFEQRARAQEAAVIDAFLATAPARETGLSSEGVEVLGASPIRSRVGTTPGEAFTRYRLTLISHKEPLYTLVSVDKREARRTARLALEAGPGEPVRFAVDMVLRERDGTWTPEPGSLQPPQGEHWPVVLPAVRAEIARREAPVDIELITR